MIGPTPPFRAYGLARSADLPRRLPFQWRESPRSFLMGRANAGLRTDACDDVGRTTTASPHRHLPRPERRADYLMGVARQ